MEPAGLFEDTPMPEVPMPTEAEGQPEPKDTEGKFVFMFKCM